MSSAWVQFRDKVVKGITKVGEHGVKGVVEDKLQKRGYDPYEAKRISNTLVSKARTGQPYDPNDPDMVEVTGYKTNRGRSLLIPLVIAGVAIAGFALTRRR